ncbi:nucleoside diphosphate kinase regulator [Thorsellia anophelis]|uniref:Regulator of nucleoside diphosphate kinase n=1 Tax=Thorsellia anophelis DSM 18579 TaxID=1123402 RepID=A0A1I0BBG9_9GAMM|nr:nucleoside diphosphate kinase regulator [Thorsellia anophelis]SET04104.1 regulator of nucleoside diphosphate kinase [Thorsellia anophelis DSM 18579]
MGKPTIIINELDAERLDALLSSAEFVNSPIANALNAELDRADIVSPIDVPANVVSMNSQIEFLDMNSGETFIRTLVYPASVKDRAEHISVMAPIGAALLGLAVGDEMTWTLPNGTASKIKVVSILYQPEAAGELHR